MGSILHELMAPWNPLDLSDRDVVTTVRAEFEVLASSYERMWRSYLETSVSHSLSALHPKGGERILDAGCGTGMLMRYVAAAAPSAELTGIDLTPAMLQRANLSMQTRAVFAVADLRRLPFANAGFDAVVISSVIQYLDDIDVDLALSETARVLKARGRLILTVWNGDAVRMRLRARWINCHRTTKVHLHTRNRVIALFGALGFQIRREDTYAAGLFWRLTTFLATKLAG